MTPLTLEEQIARPIEHKFLDVILPLVNNEGNRALAVVDELLALLPAPVAAEDVVESRAVAKAMMFEAMQPHLHPTASFVEVKKAISRCFHSASLLRAPEAPGWPKELIEGLRKQVVGCERQPSQDKLTETHLMWMLAQIEQGFVTGTKAHRWFAFVQGVLAERGLLNVGQERDRTRPFFQAMLSSAPSQQSEGRAGDPDMPDLSLCSFQYLANEMKRRGATVTPAPHGGDFASDQPAPSVDSGVSERALQKDKERLDFLDKANRSLNEKYGTTYRWRLIMNHLVNRLYLGNLVIDLHDQDPNGLQSCRDAIDAAMRDASEAAK
jgi:hypothetical protein